MPSNISIILTVVIGIFVGLTALFIKAIMDPSETFTSWHLAGSIAVVLITTILTVSIRLSYHVLSELWIFTESGLHIRIDETDMDVLAATVVAKPIRSLVREVMNKANSPSQQRTVANVIKLQSDHQRKQAENEGRIRLFTLVPMHHDAEDAATETQWADIGTQTYRALLDELRPGDKVYATAFTNSRYWWASGVVGEPFFNINADAAFRKVELHRIFGVNHSTWNAESIPKSEWDETPSKREIIEHNAKLPHSVVSTIDYSLFEDSEYNSLGASDIRDMMIICDGDKPKIAIEWDVDKRTGSVAGAYLIFGASELVKLKTAYDKIKAKATLVELGNDVTHYSEYIEAKQGMAETLSNAG